MPTTPLSKVVDSWWSLASTFRAAGCYNRGMATRITGGVLSPLERDPAGWTDREINEHPLVELGWGEIPPDRVEEARLVQLEQLRRLFAEGVLPYYAEDAEDLELLIEITGDPARFAKVCGNWRWAAENRPRPLELPPGCSTFREAGDSWFIGDG